MSVAVGGGLQTITQPFVITGNVYPIDKRTFWVDRADAAGTVNAVFTDILLNNNSQFGVDENNVGVRANLKLDGDATLVRNFDDYDLRDVLRGPSAPANVSLAAGEPTFGWDDATEYLVNGSNATLTATVDGTIDSGVTLSVIRSTMLFEQNAVLNGVVRTQTAPSRGDSFVISRSSGATTDTTVAGTGQIQLGRSVAANGPEDFVVRGTETAGPSPMHRVAVPVVLVNDGSAVTIDGIIRSDRHNDAATTARTQVDAIIIEPGATLQTVSVNQATLTLPSITIGANGGIDSTNNTSVFLGDISAAGNPIRFTGQARARTVGANVAASAVSVVGAGIDIDPGLGNTTTMTAPVSLSGVLSVRTGTLDMGTSVITGAAVISVPGLRENKTLGAFDLTTPNTSNQIQLGPVMAQLPANAWGENQTVTYTGKINIPDNGTLGDGLGSVAFAKIFDDSARIQIDGTTVFQSTAFNDAVASGAISLATGLHNIEIRLGQGVGGAGPVVADGGAFGIGLGIDLTDAVDNSQNPGVGNVLDLSQYVIPLDNGLGNLFQTTTLKAGINVAADTTLKAGAFTNIGTINMSGANSVIGVSGNSDADALIVAAGANSFLSGSTGTGFTFGSLDIASGATLTLTEPPPPSPAGALDFGGEGAGLAGPSAVPEPGSTSLLLAGLAALLGARRKSNRR